MPSGLQALLALFLLLPGFVSARIARILTARSQQSDLERVIQALMHSFLLYIIYLGVFGANLPIDWVPSGTGNAVHFQIAVHRSRILTLGALSFCLGLLWGFVKGHDFHMRILRSLRITERTSRESVWNDVLLTQSGVVQVGLGDGRVALGVLDRYSDTGEEGSLFLSEASWVTDETRLSPSTVPAYSSQRVQISSSSCFWTTVSDRTTPASLGKMHLRRI